MSNVAQATFIGGQIIVECNPDWDCCQREQAREKVRKANSQIQQAKDSGNPACVRSADQCTTAKADLYGPALEQAREDMTGSKTKGEQTKSQQEQADDAKARGAPDCLVDQIADGTVDSDDVAMDHTLEVKLGGNVWPGAGDMPLMPLDSNVNGAFGNLLKVTADEMGEGTEVEDISLVCPPSEPGCPDPPPPNARGHSTGNFQREFPETGWKTTRIT